MKPLLKWVGGKTKLLPELVKRMPKKYGRYFEPFAGGAALFFHLEPARAVLGDLNADLMNTYTGVQRDPKAVLRALRKHEQAHGKRYYYDLRDRLNRRERSMAYTVQRAAAFLYLNRTCFNGLYRENQRGLFNVPMGRYKNPTIYNPELVRSAHRALGPEVHVRHNDYKHSVFDATYGDFVYFDPPYDPLSLTSSFTAYGARGFSRDDQVELAEFAASLARRGIDVMLSNSNTKFIRDLYRGIGFKLSRVSCPRAINSDASKRGMVSELIITSRYE